MVRTVGSELLSAAELFQFGVAADEAREPTPGDRLQTGPRRASTRDLIDLDCVGNSFIA